MNLTSLLALVRRQLDDEDSTNPLWSDAELTEYFNRAIDEACFRADLIIDSETDSICEITVVEGTHTYAFSEKILDVNRLTYGADNTLLTRSAYRRLDEEGFPSVDWETDTGTPEKYLVDLHQRKLRFDRIPDADTTAALTVSRLPLTALADGADIPEIDPHYHFDLIYWVQKLAYEKRDSEANHIQLSEQAEMKFIRVFGPRPTVRWQEHKLRSTSLRAKAHFY